VPGSFDAAFAGCVGVFHVAAVLGNSASEGAQPNASGDRGKDTYEGGLTGTRNVIDAINKSGSVKRLVYTSSTSAVVNATKGAGHEWTETDWASDGHDTNSKAWETNYYGRSKVDTEHLVNAAAAASGGSWDVITMNPAMICGPLLFKAQNGQCVQLALARLLLAAGLGCIRVNGSCPSIALSMTDTGWPVRGARP
jgi:nucleoside-diphosphate-sugar epimerase